MTNVACVRQALTTDRLLGRVGSRELLIAYGVLPIGALAGGLLGASLGVREALLASMLVRLPLLLGLVLVSPLPRLRTLPTTVATSESEPAGIDAVR